MGPYDQSLNGVTTNLKMEWHRLLLGVNNSTYGGYINPSETHFFSAIYRVLHLKPQNINVFWGPTLYLDVPGS